MEKDYDEFVKEDPSLDAQLTAFDAYNQIYKAFGEASNQEQQTIRRRFGHADIILNHRDRLINTFGKSASARPQPKDGKRKTKSV